MKNEQSKDAGNIGHTRHRTKTRTNTTQKTKMVRNTNPTKNRVAIQVLAKGRHFLSYVATMVWKNVAWQIWNLIFCHGVWQKVTINIKVVVNVNKGGRGSCSFVLKFVAKSLPPVVCRALMSWLRCLCLLAYSGLQHILCCGFFFALCALCWRFLWIVRFWLPFRCSLTFIYWIIDRQNIINIHECAI